MAAILACAQINCRLPQPYIPGRKTKDGKRADNVLLARYWYTSTLSLTRDDFKDHAGLKSPCSVLASPKTNCLVLVNGPRLPNTKVEMRPDRAIIYLGSPIVPPLAYTVEVRDVLLDPRGLLIVRWPLWFYTQGVRTANDLRRSMCSQQRESEFVEAAYHPLTERPDPYPFFVPAQPLDPFWTPPAQYSLKDRFR